jgi:hypothetical protein
MRHLTPLLLLALACGSGGGSARPSDIPAPDIRVAQVGTVFFGSSATAPVTLEVGIANRGARPITLRRIEVASPGMGTYALQPTRREFNERIEGGSGKTFTVFGTAVTSVRSPTEPLSIRLTAIFEADGRSWREIVLNAAIDQR